MKNNWFYVSASDFSIDLDSTIQIAWDLMIGNYTVTRLYLSSTIDTTKWIDVYAEDRKKSRDFCGTGKKGMKCIARYTGADSKNLARLLRFRP
jgi:hypothetical protein